MIVCACRLPHWLVLGTVLTMPGCALAPERDRALEAAIREHYAAHATEEQGACRTPKIDTIQDHHLVERSADGDDVLLVRYSYFDPHADMDANWDRLVYLSQPCGGLGERRFAVAPGELGYRVTRMGGERRDGDDQR